MQWLDAYEIRARIAPSVLICFPMAITLFILFRDHLKTCEALVSASALFLVVAYGVSFWVRFCGRRVESALWESWGGAPSTRAMRWRDTAFSDDVKVHYHEAILACCGIAIGNREDEESDPTCYDERVQQAFMQVRAIVRRDEPEGVWSKHNAEYGFHRNMLGSRGMMLLLCAIGLAACAILYVVNPSTEYAIGVVVNLALVAICYGWGWHMAPAFAKQSADRYAESIWNSFLVSFRMRNAGAAQTK